MSVFKRYPQLQSGFLAPSEDMVEKPVMAPTTPASTLLNRTPQRSQQDLFYNPAIDKVVNDIIQDPIKLRDVQFQQEVLQIIGKSFAGRNFASFVSLQVENPGISQMHIEFLRETVQMVTGQIKERRVSLDTWGSMISAANPSVGGFNPGAFNTEFKHTSYGSMELSHFVVEWIRKAGWTDMILSCRVIFGRRTLHGVMGGSL